MEKKYSSQSADTTTTKNRTFSAVKIEKAMKLMNEYDENKEQEW